MCAMCLCGISLQIGLYCMYANYFTNIELFIPAFFAYFAFIVIPLWKTDRKICDSLRVHLSQKSILH